MGVNEIKILIVDDFEMIRDGIRSMLEAKIDRYEFVITESDSGEDAIDKIKKNDYDIVLMDYQLPKLTGAETICQLLIYKPELKVLAMSNYNELSYIMKMRDSGAKGYILKNVGPTELLTAIETVLNRKPYYSNDVAVNLIDNKSSIEDDKPKIKETHLTYRQIQVLKRLADGKSHEEIAKELYINKRTVDSHRQNLINKLGVNNNIGLLKCATDMGLMG